MDNLTSARIDGWLRHSAEVFAAHKDELNALDAAIGDGDHGANLARGFTAVLPKLDGLVGKEIEALLRTTGMTLISQVGGASGPLYGTFFLQAAGVAKGKVELSLAELCDGLDAGLAGIVKLGKAGPGDKTMVDAIGPALAALRPQEGETLEAALARAVTAGRAAAEATIPLVARKGRASYLGERSAGHQDPGATSSVLLLTALAEAVKA